MRAATVTDAGPPVKFKVHGATVEQEASHVIGHADPAVNDLVLVHRMESSAEYVLFVPRG